MAPSPYLLKIFTTTLLLSLLLPIMSSPNTKFAVSALKSAPKTSSSSVFSNSTSGNDGVQLVTIGKDTIAIPVPIMASINDPSYLKAACFNALSTTAYSLLDTYSASAVMMFVNQQLPVNTAIALTEASSIATTIRFALLKTENLQARCFLKKDWSQALQKHTATLTDRTAGLFAVRFGCLISGASLDHRISLDKTYDTEFALILPQHEFDSTHGTTSTHLTSPLKPFKKPSLLGRLKDVAVSLFLPSSDDKYPPFIPDNSAIDATKAHFVGGPLSDVSSIGLNSTDHSTSNSGLSSSANMAQLFEPINNSSTTKIGYYGDFNFLHSQESFDSCFGLKPKLYHASEKALSWNGGDDFATFIEACKFEIFMDICKIDYVGGEEISKETYVREVCNILAQLKQQWKDPKGRMILDTPEELFQKFIRFVSNLPEDTETWTISIPSTYLTALHEVIKKKITTSNFNLPKQSSLRTRNDHINAMRLIKNEATRVFEELQERQQEIEQGFSILNSASNKRAFVGLYTNKSLAEETIERYKGPMPGAHNANNTNATDIEVRKKSDGNNYPFHIPTQYMSQYPVGFRGCFVCGSTDHWRKESCPVTQSGNFDRKKFFHDLWAHKPHTYTKRDGILYTDKRKTPQALVTTLGTYILGLLSSFRFYFFSAHSAFGLLVTFIGLYFLQIIIFPYSDPTRYSFYYYRPLLFLQIRNLLLRIQENTAHMTGMWITDLHG